MVLLFLGIRPGKFGCCLFVQLFVFEDVFVVLCLWVLFDDELGTLIAM